MRSAPLSAAEKTLLDALDKEFDACVQTIDAQALRRLPQGDALYLLSQAIDLIDLEADYHADVIADYTFGGSAKDLKFFVQIASSVSSEFVYAYCAEVSVSDRKFANIYTATTGPVATRPKERGTF